MNRERRAHKRYVIDGLMVDIGGALHETVDISIRAVAVVRKPDMDYAQLTPPFRFLNEKAPALNQPIPHAQRLYERGRIAVIDYVVEHPHWEPVLAAHDVRADVKPLEDVFG
jgi:hypothetical protein